jgi:hypothetical protein
MERKEYYKQSLPHFQQPGQAYFVTWCLKDSVPKKALKRYTQQLEILKSQIDAGAAVGAADSDPPYEEDADRNQHHPGEKWVRRIPIRRLKKMPIGIGITRNLRHPKLKNFEKNITPFAKNT